MMKVFSKSVERPLTDVWSNGVENEEINQDYGFGAARDHFNLNPNIIPHIHITFVFENTSVP